MSFRRIYLGFANEMTKLIYLPPASEGHEKLFVIILIIYGSNMGKIIKKKKYLEEKKNNTASASVIYNSKHYKNSALNIY